MICSACRSISICVSALLLWHAPARAQEGALRVRPADRELYSSEPRQIVAAPFTVTNASDRPIEVESRLVVPARWQSVVPALPFVLEPGERAVKLVSFTIPEDAQAGEYTVTYQALDRLHPGIGATDVVRVRVIATARVQVTVLDTPDLAVAGDSIAGAAVFRNTGNAPVTLDFRVSTRNLESVTPRQGRVRLEPAESRRVELAIVAAGGVRERTAGRIAVEATAVDGSTRADGRATIQIVPRASVFDALRTLDSRLETRFVARDSSAGREAGWQPAMSGGGFLDEGREKLLRYRFRGPDRRQSGTYGAPQEYWLRYDDPHVSAGAGDLNFGVSPLTEPGRLGRGAQFAARGGIWDFKAYGMRDDFGSGVARQYAASSSWQVSPHASAGLNYLNRTTAGEASGIWSVRTQAEPAPGLTLDVEAARSESDAGRGAAQRFALHDDRHVTRYYLLGWRADPGFEGPLRDKTYLSTGFDRADPAGWSWRGYFRLQDWNLLPVDEIDPDERERRGENERLRAAPLQRQYSAGTGHALGGFAIASLDLVVRERGARDSRAWRAGLSRAWRDVSLSCALERGAGRDRRSDASFDTLSQQLTGSWRAGRFQSYGFYWTRDRGSELDERDPRRDSRGLTANYSAGAFTLKLDAQRSESRAGRTAIYDLSLLHESARGARLTLAARRIEGRFARNDYLLSYSLPFALPVGRKGGFASLRGKVWDAETAAGLAHVVLRMDGIAVSTDRRGEFEFPAVRAGTHHISVDQAGLDMRQVRTSLAPLEVTVGKERTEPLSISLVRAVSIEVSVTMRPDPGAASPGTHGLLVRFRHEQTELKRMTDEAGHARLGAVPPGRWIVSLAEDSLPAGYRPAVADVVLDLEPGAAADARIELGQMRREMRMLAPLAVR